MAGATKKPNHLMQLQAFVEWERRESPEKVHIAEWALSEIERLRSAILQTLEENGHLADGDNCTLILLKQAIAGTEDTEHHGMPLGEASEFAKNSALRLVTAMGELV